MQSNMHMEPDSLGEVKLTTDASLATSVSDTKSVIDELAGRGMTALDDDGNGHISLLEFADALRAEAIRRERSLVKGKTRTWLESEEARKVCGHQDLLSCGKDTTCFPHHECLDVASTKCESICLPAEVVHCGAFSLKIKALFLSDGLSENNLRNALRQLVLALPESAKANSSFHSGGSWYSGMGNYFKNHANTRSEFAKLAGKNFTEPSLYKGLKVLVIADACFHKRFQENPWPCEDFKEPLVEMGFRAEDVTSVQITDLVLNTLSATLKEKTLNGLKMMFDYKGGAYKIFHSPKLLMKYGKKIDARKLLDGVDLVAVNGGNSDYVTFALTKLAPQLGNMIFDRVNSGHLVYMGRSAGAMVGGRDVGVTLEPTATVSDNLLGCKATSATSTSHEKNMQGLGLIGVCSIRPHYTQDKWDHVTEVYERAKGEYVVRIPNGEGLMCMQGHCKMVGIAHGTTWLENPKRGVNYRIGDAVPHHQGKEASVGERRFCMGGKLTRIQDVEHSKL